MSPRYGEVWLVDMGMAAKVRPGLVVISDNLETARSLIIYVPITRQNRGSELEVPLGHLPFLDKESVANAQGIGSLPSVRFQRRLGVLPSADMEAVKKAMAKALGL